MWLACLPIEWVIWVPTSLQSSSAMCVWYFPEQREVQRGRTEHGGVKNLPLMDLCPRRRAAVIMEV